MYRLPFLALALCCLFAHASAARCTADTSLTALSTSRSISLKLAGLLPASAQPESRVFFTVQADVCRAGELFIAAGARARGRLLVSCSTDSTLCWVFFPEAVQTAEGTMQTLEPAFIRLAAPVCEPFALLQQAFVVEMARDEEGSQAVLGEKK
jgi:hypothetical protein